MQNRAWIRAETAKKDLCTKAILIASFVYDGDGNRVQSTIKVGGDTITTTFMGNYYETVTGETHALGKIYAGLDREWNTGTSADQLAQEAAASFPAGWQAVGHALNEVYYWEQGSAGRTRLDRLPVSLTSYTLPQFRLIVDGALARGHYILLGVNLDTETGRLAEVGVGHWVVAYGASPAGVMINNPYTNSRQFYGWRRMYRSWQHWYLELIPPANSSNTHPHFGNPVQPM